MLQPYLRSDDGRDTVVAVEGAELAYGASQR